MLTSELLPRLVSPTTTIDGRVTSRRRTLVEVGGGVRVDLAEERETPSTGLEQLPVPLPGSARRGLPGLGQPGLLDAADAAAGVRRLAGCASSAAGPDLVHGDHRRPHHRAAVGVAGRPRPPRSSRPAPGSSVGAAPPASCRAGSNRSPGGLRSSVTPDLVQGRREPVGERLGGGPVPHVDAGSDEQRAARLAACEAPAGPSAATTARRPRRPIGDADVRDRGAARGTGAEPVARGLHVGVPPRSTATAVREQRAAPAASPASSAPANPASAEPTENPPPEPHASAASAAVRRPRTGRRVGSARHRRRGSTDRVADPDAPPPGTAGLRVDGPGAGAPPSDPASAAVGAARSWCGCGARAAAGVGLATQSDRRPRGR